MDLDQYRRILVQLSVGVFIIGFAFDLVVTVTVFKVNPNLFVNLEANREIVEWFTKGSIPVISTIGNVVPLLLVGVLYYSELRFKKDWIDSILLMSLVFILSGGIIHLNGGLSWLMI